MELLETARVDAYRNNEVIIPAARRGKLLCVVWEGTCTESFDHTTSSTDEIDSTLAVWYAGDWTGPIVLQPNRSLSGESTNSSSHNIVAVSSEGVKVITVEFSSLHAILNNGSSLYKKYLERMLHQDRVVKDISSGRDKNIVDNNVVKDLNVLELLNCNSALRKLNAVQKRHVESLAEGPVSFQPNERMWQAGAPVDRAYIIISGTASFHVSRNTIISKGTGGHDSYDRDASSVSDSAGDSKDVDVMRVNKELERHMHGHHLSDDNSDMSSVECEDDRLFSMDWLGMVGHQGNNNNSAFADSKDFDIVVNGLQARAHHLAEKGSISSDASQGDDSHETENELAHEIDDVGNRTRRSSSIIKRRGSRARIANKVLGRLYNRRVFTSRLVFSKGHFLGDVSKMVAGLLSSEEHHTESSDTSDDEGPTYGFGEKAELDDDDNKRTGKVINLTIHEREGDHLILHSSTLTAGKDGCVALVFPKSSLIPLLDEYPGLLLSLLGTQVVV